LQAKRRRQAFDFQNGSDGLGQRYNIARLALRQQFGVAPERGWPAKERRLRETLFQRIEVIAQLEGPLAGRAEGLDLVGIVALPAEGAFEVCDKRVHRKEQVGLWFCSVNSFAWTPKRGPRILA
jgi:hypothetical protein